MVWQLKRNKQMKLTKTQLKRIIKEELSSFNESKFRRQHKQRTMQAASQRAQRFAMQGKEDAREGRPKNPEITHGAYGTAYDEEKNKMQEGGMDRLAGDLMDELQELMNVHRLTSDDLRGVLDDMDAQLS
jgi:predicted KAP-like P-loop ATPase